MKIKLQTIGKKDFVRYKKKCSVSGEIYVVDVPVENYKQWIEGELIQEACPQLSADEREFVISGKTPEEFKKRSAQIELMTTEQKGFYLLNAVRQISFGAGEPESDLITALVDLGGILNGLAGQNLNVGKPN